jgi:hypothetical protein
MKVDARSSPVVLDRLPLSSLDAAKAWPIRLRPGSLNAQASRTVRCGLAENFRIALHREAEQHAVARLSRFGAR